MLVAPALMGLNLSTKPVACTVPLGDDRIMLMRRTLATTQGQPLVIRARKDCLFAGVVEVLATCQLGHGLRGRRWSGYGHTHKPRR
jgi:hypothetical protein